MYLLEYILVTEYRKSIAAMKGDYTSVKQKLERQELMNNGTVDNRSNYNKEQRQRLLDTNDKINRQNEKILSAQRTVAETEEVGAEIIEELGRNREKIQSSHNKIKEFVGLTDSGDITSSYTLLVYDTCVLYFMHCKLFLYTARRILSSMSRRENHQKMTIAFICVALLVIVVMAWYYS